jgi:hypothetical protein
VPPELIVRMVVVAEGKAHACEGVPNSIPTRLTDRNSRERYARFTDLLQQLLRLEL